MKKIIIYACIALFIGSIIYSLILAVNIKNSVKVNFGDRTDGGDWYAVELTQSSVYPTLAVGVGQIASGTALSLSNYTTLVPPSTITTDFSIKALVIEGLSATGTYEMVIYSSSTSAITEVARTKFNQQSNVGSFPHFVLNTPILDANVAILGKLSSSVASARATTTLLYTY